MSTLENKKVSLFSSIAMLVGMIVGSGIFVSPAIVFTQTGASYPLSLLVWIVAGVISTFGALCYAELGCLIQDNGGEQAYLKQSFGQFASFMFSYFNVLIGKPGSIAIILITFAEYFIKLFGSDSDAWKKLIACCCCVMLSVVNLKGVGLKFQDVSTVLKMLALVVIVILAIVKVSQQGLPQAKEVPQVNLLKGLPIALYQALWGMDGWNNLNLITAELVDPANTLVTSLSFGIPSVTVIYIIMNLAFFAVLPADVIVQTKAIGYSFGQQFPLGAVFIIVVVCVATLGTANASLYTSARLVVASAKDGMLPFSDYFGKLDNDVPARAIGAQCVMVIIYLALGSYTQLVNLYSWTVWIFYAMTCASVLILRRTDKTERLYKVPTFMPIVFIAFSSILIILPLFTMPFDVLGAVVVFVVCAIIYAIQNRNQSQTEYTELETV